MNNQVLVATEKLCEILANNYEKTGYNNPKRYIVRTGKKFLKIIMLDHGQTSGSVHGFVDINTGDLYKAASWAAPAKGIRFNLFRDMELLKNHADWCGRYLYR